MSCCAGKNGNLSPPADNPGSFLNFRRLSRCDRSSFSSIFHCESWLVNRASYVRAWREISRFYRCCWERGKTPMRGMREAEPASTYPQWGAWMIWWMVSWQRALTSALLINRGTQPSTAVATQKPYTACSTMEHLYMSSKNHTWKWFTSKFVSSSWCNQENVQNLR